MTRPRSNTLPATSRHPPSAQRSARTHKRTHNAHPTPIPRPSHAHTNAHLCRVVSEVESVVYFKDFFKSTVAFLMAQAAIWFVPSDQWVTMIAAVVTLIVAYKGYERYNGRFVLNHLRRNKPETIQRQIGELGRGWRHGWVLRQTRQMQAPLTHSPSRAGSHSTTLRRSTPLTPPQLIF